MKFLAGFFLTGIIVIIYSFSYAQSSYTITGRVIITSTSFAGGATITLLQNSDSSSVKSTVCNNQGVFELKGVAPGNYILLINKIGYQKLYSSPIRIVNVNIHLPDVLLLPATKDLKEVTITAKRDYIEVKPDKTILNVDRSILAAGNSVFDILGTAPGVRILDNGVYIKGGQKALIAIDGKPIGQLTDEQLADLLKSYQSSMITQIEIISNPPARYDAAGGGVINIILKKSKDYGFKANIIESAAAGQDYRLSSGINLDYRIKNLNFFGNYNFSDSKIPRILDIDRTIGSTALNENYLGITHLLNNGFNGGIDYNLSAKQTVGVLMYGYHNQIDIDKNNTTDILNQGSLDSNITTNSHINRSITNLNYNFNYKGSFGKEDNTTLSADFDYSTYRRNSAELLENNFFDADGIQYQDPLFYVDNSPSQINVRSERIDFTQVLSKTGTLGLGLRNNQANSNNMIDFKQRSSADSVYIPVPSLTDHFTYDERINAAYINYDDKLNNTGIALGLRAEQTSSLAESLNPNKTTSSSYLDFFPNVEITQWVDKDNTLVVAYNRRLTRPQYQDLNPFVAYIDEYSYSTGNTFLKPEYFTTYQVTDVFKQKYKLDLSVQVTTDFFVNIFQQNDSTKVFTSTISNIGTRYEYNAEATLPVDVTKWWNANVYLYGSYQKYVYNTGNPDKTTTDFEIKITQNFTLAHTIRAELFTGWESPTYYGIKQYADEWSTRAGVSKSILNDNGSIKLAISDIFNSQEYRYTSQYQNLNLTGFEKAGSRFVTATFTYRFGRQTIKSNKQQNGNADELKRLNPSTIDN